jgi:coproporphyrinogen III oxidase
MVTSLLVFTVFCLGLGPSVSSFTSSTIRVKSSSTISLTSSKETEKENLLFDSFCSFLQTTQSEIISQLEALDGSNIKFTSDAWGKFESSSKAKSGGITRVLQGGKIIEKGACSLTVIQQGTLTQERAMAIRSRQGDVAIQEGDIYSAAALSIVLHSRSPLVPTFRSDVRIFVVSSQNSGTNTAWFGGGADLTPYYLDEKDIHQFHVVYQELADSYHLGEDYTYQKMKEACDDYFYLPARSEHRGTGGIFFDDLPANPESLSFVRGVAEAWVPSWSPIVEKHRNAEYSAEERHWQLIRRGRYLEFNLLYDRGVKFGLANANPRVEGVMVSAPPLIAWEYNHVIKPGSPEARIMKVLKEPRSWA